MTGEKRKLSSGRKMILSHETKRGAKLPIYVNCILVVKGGVSHSI